MTAPEPRDPALGTTRTSLPIMLLRAREAVMARFRPMLHEIGVTEQQWRVLRVLDEGGELDVSTVAHRAAILPPSLTRILKSLREKGLVAIRRDRDDGRRSLAALTGTGRDLILGAAPDSAMIYAEISRLYGMERLDALMAEIDALIGTLQDEPDEN
jgi:homoprotocatechuate degradation regulator HpaR